MEPFVNFVIRPPRAEYTVDDLLEPQFTIKGRTYQRKDLELRNSRGHLLQCSHYVPLVFPEDTKLPCVIYCHGNSGCRADGNEAAIVLLPSNITVFTLDFSGSGLSDGDFVSLGWNEKDDLRAAVSYLRSLNQTLCIGLWGRSMGAVTSLLYGAADPSIAGMVLDSPFSNLFNLMMELVDSYKIRLPKFTIRVALQIMRRIIQKRAQFDIMDMNIVRLASKTFIPALFGHAAGDAFIPPHHSGIVHKEYAGDKNIIKFEGDHNSSRPQFYYDSVTIFFHNVLCPPPTISADDTLDLLDCSAVALPSHRQSMELASGNLEHPIDVIELLKKVKSGMNAPVLPAWGHHLFERSRDIEGNGDCYSYPSSHGASMEGWGRCSSKGISENSAVSASPSWETFAEAPINANDEEKMILKAITASLKETVPLKSIVAPPIVVQGTVVRKKCTLKCLSRRFTWSCCFKGMSKKS